MIFPRFLGNNFIITYQRTEKVHKIRNRNKERVRERERERERRERKRESVNYKEYQKENE
jgi:hypothetical protein